MLWRLGVFASVVESGTVLKVYKNTWWIVLANLWCLIGLKTSGCHRTGTRMRRPRGGTSVLRRLVDESGWFGVQKTRKRRRNREALAESLAPEDVAYFERVGWEYCAMKPAIRRSARLYSAVVFDANERLRHRDVDFRGDIRCLESWGDERRRKTLDSA